MRLFKIFVCLFFLVNHSYGQVFPSIKTKNEKDVIEEFSKIGQSRTNKLNGYKQTITKNGDTLLLNVIGKENFLIKLTFNLKNGFCNYQRIDFSCDTCTVLHLTEIMNSKRFKWKEVEPNKYISKWKFQTAMEVIKIDNLCSSIIYTFVDKDKKEYQFDYKN